MQQTKNSQPSLLQQPPNQLNNQFLTQTPHPQSQLYSKFIINNNRLESTANPIESKKSDQNIV